MKKYQTLFFDLDNTLWDFDKNAYQALKITFEKFGFIQQGFDYEAFYLSYSKNNDQAWDEYRKKIITKQELIQKRFLLTFADCGIKGADPISFNDFYLDEMPNQTILVDGASEILDFLKSKKYKMYIITNGFKEVQGKKLNKSGLSKYFEKSFISEILKAPKPSPEIFEYALKSTNSKKKQSIMIGDSWDVDILGAMNAGIDQIHYINKGSIDFNRNEIEKINSSKTLTYRINSLLSLVDFFNKKV